MSSPAGSLTMHGSIRGSSSPAYNRARDNTISCCSPCHNVLLVTLHFAVHVSTQATALSDTAYRS